MPRQARIDAPGAVHHVIIRGIERGKIFLDSDDRHSFLDRLGAIVKESETACYAWALLDNHMHLVFRTGLIPLAAVMRRLLTGHAVRFNRRHRRYGPLFQNRYKSILCQEDPYLLELVRYVHLNPLRAKIISQIEQLDRYVYSGHSAIMGKRKNDWQDVEYVLGLFGAKVSAARRRYREFVKKGIEQGKRPELVGGGLIRSMGGWSSVKALRRSGERIKGDERILGDSEFVEKVLSSCDEALERKYAFRFKGHGFDWLVEHVAKVLAIDTDQVLRSGRYPLTVKARSVLCYWATRDIGMTTVDLARKLGMSQPTISQSVQRGEKIVAQQGLTLFDEL